MPKRIEKCIAELNKLQTDRQFMRANSPEEIDALVKLARIIKQLRLIEGVFVKGDFIFDDEALVQPEPMRRAG